MQVFTLAELWLMSILKTVEAREIRGSLARNQSEVEWQAVLHQGNLHPLDDRSFVLQHLNHELLDISVAVVQLLDVELIDDADSETFKESWRVDLVVADPLDVPNPVHACEVKAV